MPRNNRFLHQKYRSGPPTSVVQYLRPALPSPGKSEEFERRMRAVGTALRDAGVAAIYLVHGTFVGPDALGMLSELSRVAPSLAETLRHHSKQILDAAAGETGNFTRAYAALMERSLGADNHSPIPVRLFHWSSGNHHIGRADGAVKLIDQLCSLSLTPGSRVLLWAHSHGGNVLALVTNLLGSELAARRQFFRCARPYFDSPVFRQIDLPEWHRVRERTCAHEEVLPGVKLDLVTFGTPVRYGWDTNGYGNLIHFIHHRPVAGQPEYLAPFPPLPDDVLKAAHGDLIQQLGIAGTNLVPQIWEWRAWWADVQLGRLLQSNCRASELIKHWRLGIRTHDEGTNLLVDYEPCSFNVAQHLFGHAVYTRREWMPFHAEEICQRWYGLIPE